MHVPTGEPESGQTQGQTTSLYDQGMDVLLDRKPGSGKETMARQNGVRFEGFTLLEELALQVIWLHVSRSWMVREGEMKT